MSEGLKCVASFLFGLIIGGCAGFFIFAWFASILRNDRRDQPSKPL